MNALRKSSFISLLLALTVTGSANLSQAVDDQALTGTVIETMDNGGYTYVQIENNSGKTWVAVPKTQVVKGQELTFAPGTKMDNFESKSLKRKFDRITFSSGVLETAKTNAETEVNSLAEAAFAEVARSYRAAAVKPTLPEEARKFKVQAEYAFNKKEFDGAVMRYQAALDKAPWWPEGHFNRALILSELSRYREAIVEMKKYLTLVPEAPDVRAAQDRIYQWESELK